MATWMAQAQGLAQGETLVFRAVDMVRWRQGKAQRAGNPWSWLVGASLLAIVAINMHLAVPAWKAQPWPRAFTDPKFLGLALEILLWCAVGLGLGVAQWVSDRRALVLTDSLLTLRYPWAWLDRQMGWSVPLPVVARRARWVPHRPQRAQVPDLLPAFALELPLADSAPWRALVPRRLLSPAQWAPLRDGVDVSGPWPAPATQPTAWQMFLMRTPPVDAAALRDLDRRMAQLPLVQALQQRGVVLPRLSETQDFPSRLETFGQLDLAQVPALRRGLWALLALLAASVLALLAWERWQFFATPWALYLGAGLAGTVLGAVLLWPREVAHQPGMAQASARQQARAAAAFMALLGGAMAAWLAGAALPWAGAGAWQPPRAMVFTLDKRTLDPGPIVLRPVAGAGVPPIEINTGVSFWRRQADGAQFVLPVARIPGAGWWVYDGQPLIDARRRPVD